MSARKVAIVTAMELEVWPLVKNWSRSRRQFEGREFMFFEKGDTTLVCAGIGAEYARRAAEAIIQLCRPDLLVSAGFAGALQPDWPVGRVLIPRVVIDACDNSRTETVAGEGSLVSFATVADASQKEKLRRAYDAQAVDMEAAAIGRGAMTHGIPFRVCKVISDASDFSVPAGTQFVGPDGKFQKARFAFHVAPRPWLWWGTIKLAADSLLAARNLCQSLVAFTETTASVRA